MVQVVIWGSLRSATGGQASVEVDASNFKDVLSQLSLNYPGLKPRIDSGVSLAIDGRIYREAWFTPVQPDSEVILMPLMVGG
ncbi:MAG: MoaD/ThiS family protein [Paracoccaceae bacterium]